MALPEKRKPKTDETRNLESKKEVTTKTHEGSIDFSAKAHGIINQEIPASPDEIFQAQVKIAEYEDSLPSAKSVYPDFCPLCGWEMGMMGLCTFCSYDLYEESANKKITEQAKRVNEQIIGSFKYKGEISVDAWIKLKKFQRHMTCTGIGVFPKERFNLRKLFDLMCSRGSTRRELPKVKTLP